MRNEIAMVVFCQLHELVNIYRRVCVLASFGFADQPGGDLVDLHPVGKAMLPWAMLVCLFSPNFSILMSTEKIIPD